MDVSKNVVDATNSKYSKDAKQTNAINEYTKSFCDTDQYKTSKKITEITMGQHLSGKKLIDHVSQRRHVMRCQINISYVTL